MKCEHDIKHTNCTHYNENCYSTRICIKYSDFECKLCKEESESMNKPLTITELEQMNGLPVWIEAINSGWYLVDAMRKVCDRNKNMYDFNYIYNTDIKAYRQKPSPRMVTLETAIKEGLMVKSKRNGKFGKPLDLLLEIVLTNSIYNKCDYLFDAVWEVKEG